MGWLVGAASDSLEPSSSIELALVALQTYHYSQGKPHSNQPPTNSQQPATSSTHNPAPTSYAAEMSLNRASASASLFTSGWNLRASWRYALLIVFLSVVMWMRGAGQRAAFSRPVCSPQPARLPQHARSQHVAMAHAMQYYSKQLTRIPGHPQNLVEVTLGMDNQAVAQRAPLLPLLPLRRRSKGLAANKGGCERGMQCAGAGTPAENGQVGCGIGMRSGMSQLHCRYARSLPAELEPEGLPLPPPPAPHTAVDHTMPSGRSRTNYRL